MSMQQEYSESVLGFPKGGYDPDSHGFWFEHEVNCYLRVHGGFGNECDCIFSAVKQAITDVHIAQEAIRAATNEK